MKHSKDVLRQRRVLAGLAASIIAFAGCTAAAPEAKEPSVTEDTSITIAVPALTFTDHDPFEGSYMYSALNMHALFESLLVLDESTGRYEPWLAEEYSVSDDRRTLTFRLRDDVDFVDGTHLDAETVVAYFDALLASEGYRFRAVLSDRFGAEFSVTGEYTFEVTTTSPIDLTIVGLLGLLAVYTPIASPAMAGSPDAQAESPIGSGPYLIDEVTPDVEMSFVRNPDYWNPQAYPFDTVVLKVFADDVAALNALKTGQVDAAGLSIPVAVEAEAEGFVTHSGAGLFRALFITDRGGTIQPALADVRVRQAMNMAFDRQAIAENLHRGYAPASSQLFTKGQPEYLEDRDDEYPYDLEAARALMAEAGYADGFDLVIPTTTTGGGAQGAEIASVAPIVQQSLADIGIRVEFEQVADYTALLDEAVPSGTYPVILMSDAYANNINHSIAGDGLWNAQGYVDPIAEDLADTVRNGSVEESAKASQALGEYVLEQAWFVPFSQPNILFASIPTIHVEVGDLVGAPHLRNFTNR